ncbi:MAG: thioredoxin domain-containing protein [Deltaproteobacteria bacterium]|nr:thioredoxin domain-containing protein [Deltaproteobacteria bacterium]MCB9786743.1 thioredoxin domain-containing protein [Deltaproteobacteria bacterium]
MNALSDALSESPARGGGRTALLATLALTLCTLTQCVCQSTREDGPTSNGAAAGAPQGAGTAPAATAEPAPAPAKVELPSRLDIRDLDVDEQRLLAEVLREQFDPCGEPRSFMEALQADKPCDRALSLGTYTVTLVQKGLSKRLIARELMKELARTTSKMSFDLTGVAHAGDPAAEHVIVEFLDYQCPFCKQTFGPLRAAAKKYGAVVYVKQLPLTAHHPHALAAAHAALAAQRQGRFWEMSEAMFDNQERLSDDVIKELARQVGLDMQRFETDLKDPELDAILARDEAEADAAKVDGTPSIYLDGYLVEHDQLEEKLREATAKP